MKNEKRSRSGQFAGSGHFLGGGWSRSDDADRWSCPPPPPPRLLLPPLPAFTHTNKHSLPSPPFPEPRCRGCDHQGPAVPRNAGTNTGLTSFPPAVFLRRYAASLFLPVLVRYRAPRPLNGHPESVYTVQACSRLSSFKSLRGKSNTKMLPDVNLPSIELN